MDELVDHLKLDAYRRHMSALDTARHVASGVALNHYLSVPPDDVTVGELNEIFRECFDAGVRTTHLQGENNV